MSIEDAKHWAEEIQQRGRQQGLAEENVRLVAENQKLREALVDIRHAVRDPRISQTQLCKNINLRATQALQPKEASK